MWKSFKLSPTLFLATSALVMPFTAGFCGTNPTQAEVEVVQKYLSTVKVNGTLKQGASFIVPVAFNIFYDEANPSDGNLTESVITKQMEVINSFFNIIGLNFKINDVVRRGLRDNVFHNIDAGTEEEATIKQYHQGDERTLNIYTVGATSDVAYGGWSTLPWNYESEPQNDGVVVRYPGLPQGSAEGWNTGKITVHEIGHWVGLLHTFEGGCDGIGDLVDDTPVEGSPASGCPVHRDTCPAKGKDPVDNLMDYSNDDCRVRFTDGQYNNAAQFLYQYRGINLFT